MIYFLYIFKIKYYTLSILCGGSALFYSIRATAANIDTVNILNCIVLKIEKEGGFPPCLLFYSFTEKFKIKEGSPNSSSLSIF